MNTSIVALFAAAALPAATPEWTTPVSTTVVDGQSWVYVDANRPVALSVQGAAGQELVLDVMRVSATPGRGVAWLRLSSDGRMAVQRVRPPTEKARAVPGGGFASFPVRYRFTLPASGVVPFRLATREDRTSDQLLVSVKVAARSGQKASAFLVADAPAPRRARVKTRRKRTAGRRARTTGVAARSGATRSETPRSETQRSETPRSRAPQAAAPGQGPASNAASPRPAARPDPKSRPVPHANVHVRSEKTTPAEPWPVRLTAEVQGGLGLMAGGLSPTAGLVGLGVRFGAAEGLPITVGLGLDLEQQSASLPDQSRTWVLSATRARLDMMWHAATVNVAGLDLETHVGAGAGIWLGEHAVNLGPTVKTGLSGVSYRVRVREAVKLGPGAVYLEVPLDGAADLSGSTRGLTPVAASLALGYSLRM